jgi:DNA mismatch repair protein MSH2
MLERNSILVARAPKSYFTESSTISKLVTEIDHSFIPPIAALTKYLKIDLTEGHRFEQYNLQEYMKLSITAISSLGLLGSNSLFSLLNRCKTSQGSRMLEQWIRMPLLLKSDIETRHNLVELLFENPAPLQNLREELRHFPDLIRLSKKFKRQSGNLQDVIRLYQVVTRMQNLSDTLSQFDGVSKFLLDELILTKLNEYHGKLQPLKEMVETTVDLEAADRHEYLIKPDFDNDLRGIKERMSDIQAEMDMEARSVADDLNLEFEKKLKFENNSTYGYHLRLTRTVIY